MQQIQSATLQKKNQIQKKHAINCSKCWRIVSHPIMHHQTYTRWCIEIWNKNDGMVGIYLRSMNPLTPYEIQNKQRRCINHIELSRVFIQISDLFNNDMCTFGVINCELNHVKGCNKAIPFQWIQDLPAINIHVYFSMKTIDREPWTQQLNKFNDFEMLENFLKIKLILFNEQRKDSPNSYKVFQFFVFWFLVFFLKKSYMPYNVINIKYASKKLGEVQEKCSKLSFMCKKSLKLLTGD